MPLQCQHLEFQNEYFSHYYLCNYRPQHKGADALSESLIRFKMKRRIDVEAWTYCAIIELNKLLESKPLIISRALSRDELTASLENHSALDWMGKEMQRELNASYLPESLSKIRSTRAIKMLTRTEREEELRDVYCFHQPTVDYSNVLVIDDILTTGTTLKEIVRVIRSQNPDVNITLFTLANTDHDAILNQKVTLTGYDYTWQNDQWTTIAEERETYLAIEHLKSCIINDDFR